MNPFLRNPSAHVRTPIRAEAPAPRTTDGTATLRLYDPIDSWGGEWGVSAKEFVKVLDGLPADTTNITLLINSPGGMVWEGLAILNALRSHPAKVTAVVEGIAASAASFIAAGVDELHMAPNAELMIHRAWAMCIGNSVDLQKMVAELDREDRNLASIYAGKAGGDLDEWLAHMSAETFFYAAEAVEVGLADKVLPTPKKDAPDAAAEAKARFDLSALSARHRDQPAAQAQPEPEPALAAPVLPDAPAPDLPAVEPEPEITEPKEDPVSTLSDDMRSRLDLPEGADDNAIMAAVEARLAAAAKPAEPSPEILAAVKAANEVAARAEAGRTEMQNELTRLSTELAAIKASAATDAKKALFDSAVQQGKIAPADRESWENRYDKAPEVIGEILASIAPGTAVPVIASGSIGSPEPTTGSDAEWDELVARLDGPTAGKGV